MCFVVEMRLLFRSSLCLSTEINFMKCLPLVKFLKFVGIINILWMYRFEQALD